jgi:hypothetical protein
LGIRLLHPMMLPRQGSNAEPDYAASSADFGMAQSGNKPVFPER